MKGKAMAAAVAAVVVLALLLGLMGGPAQTVEAAPMAAPTPVAAYPSAEEGRLVYFWNGDGLTADTTQCFEMGDYDRAFFVYKIDQGTVNTTTLTLRYGNDTTDLVDGLNLVASNAADATSGNEMLIFGRYTCVLANVTNSNLITFTVSAFAE